MKEFSKFELATIKRTAQNVNPMVTKKNKIKKQIDALQKEFDQLVLMQEQYEAPIKTMTGGYTTEDLVEKVVELTGKNDDKGNPIKVTSYRFKYDSIIPPLSSELPKVIEVDMENMNEETGRVPSEPYNSHMQELDI